MCRLEEAAAKPQPLSSGGRISEWEALAHAPATLLLRARRSSQAPTAETAPFTRGCRAKRKRAESIEFDRGPALAVVGVWSDRVLRLRASRACGGEVW